MTVAAHSHHIRAASIKVSARKRRDPATAACLMTSRPGRLNESLPKKEGKCPLMACAMPKRVASMKALPKRKGNAARVFQLKHRNLASMKALPKRKGNPTH